MYQGFRSGLCKFYFFTFWCLFCIFILPTSVVDFLGIPLVESDNYTLFIVPSQYWIFIEFFQWEFYYFLMSLIFDKSLFVQVF